MVQPRYARSTASREGDLAGGAEFLVAKVRWARNEDRPAAIALARAARAQLGALPYPTSTVAEIDRWLRWAR
jgi:hypothetical protein